MSLYLMLAGAMALSGGVMMALSTVLNAAPASVNQIVPRRPHPIAAARFRRLALVNSLVSIGVVFGLTFLLQGVVFHGASVSIERSLLVGAAILMVYDFLYYLVHRYPFHEWKLLRKVHAVHHVIRTPTALDSLYLHPLENAIGLTLLWATAALVSLVAGPISGYTFGWVFLVYTTLNILIHCGIRFSTFPLNIVTYLAQRHTHHHNHMKALNYSSVTPLPDLLFGTEVKRGTV